MKKTSSVVWKFFDRVLENGRCVCVVCKLCECQYKFFGNTTNLRVHLINKHPVQWELSGSGADPNFSLEDALAAGTITTGPPTKRRKYKSRDSANKNVRYAVQVNDDEAAEGVMPKIEIQRVHYIPTLLLYSLLSLISCSIRCMPNRLFRSIDG